MKLRTLCIPLLLAAAGSALAATTVVRVVEGQRFTDAGNLPKDEPKNIDALGYAGDYSFEVFNDDYVNMPLDFVAARARSSALWLAEDVLRRSAPLPGQLRLRTA